MAWQFDHAVPAQYPRLFSTQWLKRCFIKWKSEPVVLLPSILLSLFISLWIKAKGFVIKRHRLCLPTSHLSGISPFPFQFYCNHPSPLVLSEMSSLPNHNTFVPFLSCKLSLQPRHSGQRPHFKVSDKIIASQWNFHW